MKFLILTLTIFSLHQISANDINLNEICHGILFQAIAHPYDSNLFIGCVQGRGTIFGCESDYDVFDPDLIECVNPNLITTTERDKTTTTTSQVTTTTMSPPSGECGVPVSFVCPQDVTSNGLLIPNAQHCDRYAECFFGVANMRFCEGDLHFDVITRTCLDPSVAFCGNLIHCSV